MVRKKEIEGYDGDRGLTTMKGQGLGIRSLSKQRCKPNRAPHRLGGEGSKMDSYTKQIGDTSAEGSNPVSGTLVFTKSITANPSVMRPEGMPKLEDVDADILINMGEHVNERTKLS